MTTHSITAPNSILEWRTQQAPQFGLDFLPPYSPDLNPIERVWKLTRRLCLHNRYFGFLDGVVADVEDQSAEWTKPNDPLRRLCAITEDAVFRSTVSRRSARIAAGMKRCGQASMAALTVTSKMRSVATLSTTAITRSSFCSARSTKWMQAVPRR